MATLARFGHRALDPPASSVCMTNPSMDDGKKQLCLTGAEESFLGLVVSSKVARRISAQWAASDMCQGRRVFVSRTPDPGAGRHPGVVCCC
jgi:hypothetical protein